MDEMCARAAPITRRALSTLVNITTFLVARVCVCKSLRPNRNLNEFGPNSFLSTVPGYGISCVKYTYSQPSASRDCPLPLAMFG